MDLAKKIRTIPDFPVKGILFRDITTLLKDPEAFNYVIEAFAERYKDREFDTIIGVESRGFILGAPLAHRLKKAFVPVRKPGKLPADTARVDYKLEYGQAALEMHKDAIEPGDRVLVVDDLLATGGTVAAARKLVEDAGGQVVGFAFLIELEPLKGRDKLAGHDVFSLVKYDEA